MPHGGVSSLDRGSAGSSASDETCNRVTPMPTDDTATPEQLVRVMRPMRYTRDMRVPSVRCVSGVRQLHMRDACVVGVPSVSCALHTSLPRAIRPSRKHSWHVPSRQVRSIAARVQLSNGSLEAETLQLPETPASVPCAYSYGLTLMD